jgi:hypothetical protein
MEIGQKMSELKFKLVDAATGEELVLPKAFTTLTGQIVVRDWKPSRFIGNPGYIYTTLNETLVPSVIGAQIVEVL